MINIQASDTVSTLPKQEFSVIVGKVHCLRNQGHDVINLGQGNPDLPTPSHIVDVLKVAAENPNYHKYSPFRGYSFLKNSIAEFYKREYGVEIDPEHEVAIFNGGKTALYVLSQCLLNENDYALVPDPGYPEYLSGIHMAKAIPSFFELNESNDYLPDFSSISKSIAEKSKLIYLNYPHNPTGASANKQTFDEAIKFSKENNVAVLHDFAYGAFGYKEKPISFLSCEGAKDVGIEVYTLSKTYNMAGWRVAFAVGNPKIISAINQFQDHVFVSLFGAIQEASHMALTSDQACVERFVEIYEERKNYFVNECERRLGWSLYNPSGTFYVWGKIPSSYTSFEFSNYILDHAHIASTPGRVFGRNGENYVRFSLTEDLERLKEAIDRLEKLHLYFQ
jgi:aspartate/methionine/tyrosine aminotransferase